MKKLTEEDQIKLTLLKLYGACCKTCEYYEEWWDDKFQNCAYPHHHAVGHVEPSDVCLRYVQCGGRHKPTIRGH